MARKRKFVGAAFSIIIVTAIVLLWDRLSGNANTSNAAVIELKDCQIATYFSPQGGCEDAIVSIIDNAKKTLDCAIYTFTSREIAQAIAKAHERGVYVRVIMDRSQAADGYAKKRYLMKLNIPVRTHIGDGIMHHKFLVADTLLVITGSYNWTASANQWNYENIVIIRSADLAKTFESEFEKLWNKFE